MYRYKVSITASQAAVAPGFTLVTGGGIFLSLMALYGKANEDKA